MDDSPGRASRRGALALLAASFGATATATASARDASTTSDDQNEGRNDDGDPHDGREPDDTDDERTVTEATLSVRGVTVPDDAVDASLADATSGRDDTAEAIAEELEGVRPGDVVVRSAPDAVEVLAAVDTDDVAAAVEAALDVSVDAGSVEDAPTGETVAETGDSVGTRLSVATEPPSDDAKAPTATGRAVTAEIDGTDLVVTVEGDVREALPRAFAVRETRVVAHYPAATERGYERDPLLRSDDVADLGVPSIDHTGSWSLQLELTGDGSEAFDTTLVEAGFTEDGVHACSGGQEPSPEDYCLLTLGDDEVVFGVGLAPELAQKLESEPSSDGREFRMLADSFEEIQRLRLGFVDDLPAPVTVASASLETVDATELGAVDGGTPSGAAANHDGADSDATDPVPGFGIAGSLAGLGVGGLLLARLSGNDE